VDLEEAWGDLAGDLDSTPMAASGTTGAAHERRQAAKSRHGSGMAMTAVKSEKVSRCPRLLDVASPLRRRQRRTKTWAAPPAPAEEEGGRQRQGDGVPRPQLMRAQTSQLPPSHDLTPPGSLPSTPGGTSPAERRRRRAGSWLAQPETPGPSEPVPQLPRAAPLMELRQRAWTAQPSPAERSTPSVVSPGNCSIGTSSTTSRFSGRSAEDLGPVPSAQVSPGLGWKLGAKVGSGSYGSVHKALDNKTGQIFAVKKALIEEEAEEDHKFRDKLEGELRICRDLRHPHIVSYLGHDHADSYLYIYLEYVPGGSVASILREFGPIEGPLLQKGTRGLLEGLNYLHTRSPPVVHRDIKGANVLVDFHFRLKLADFGCSKRDVNTKSFTTMGSIPWMAPEVIQQQDGHGRKADIWSLGCTVIEMATADKPWGRDSFDNMMFALRHIGLSDAVPPIPEYLPEAGRELVAACVRRAAGERPTAAELLSWEYVRNLAGGAGR